MKIGLVLDRADASGLGRWTLGLARHLAAHGHAPHLLAFEGAGLPEAGLTILPRGATPLARARAAAAGVAGLGADVVLDTGTGWSGDVLLPWAGSRRMRLQKARAARSRLERVRTTISPATLALDLSLARLERLQVRSARHIIAVSGLVRELLLAQHAVAPETISVVPNGVDLARFAPPHLTAERARMRETLGVGDGVLFLAAARDLWLNGVDTLINAFDLLVYEGADVHLAIAGAAPDASWQRMAAASGARIRFLGEVADLVPALAAADALVHPTRWDACSLCTIEAGAAGRAVVTSRRNGAAEAIVDGRTGLLLDDPEDIAALAATLRRLLDPALRDALGTQARAAAATHAIEADYDAVTAILEAHARPR